MSLSPFRTRSPHQSKRCPAQSLWHYATLLDTFPGIPNSKRPNLPRTTVLEARFSNFSFWYFLTVSYKWFDYRRRKRGKQDRRGKGRRRKEGRREEKGRRMGFNDLRTLSFFKDSFNAFEMFGCMYVCAHASNWESGCDLFSKYWYKNIALNIINVCSLGNIYHERCWYLLQPLLGPHWNSFSVLCEPKADPKLN